MFCLLGRVLSAGAGCIQAFDSVRDVRRDGIFLAAAAAAGDGVCPPGADVCPPDTPDDWDRSESRRSRSWSIGWDRWDRSESRRSRSLFLNRGT